MTTNKSGAPLAIAAAAMLALSTLLDRRGSKSSGSGVIFEHTKAMGTTAKGNTRPIEALLRAHGFEWLAASELWYIRKTRGLSESPVDLDALQAQAEAILARDSGAGGGVLPFRPRTAPSTLQAPQAAVGHTGDVAFLGSDGSSVSLSSFFGKSGPHWGTSAPYAVGRVGPDRVGYADIPTLSVDLFGRAADVGVLTPIARQLAMLAAEVNGLTLNMAPPGLKRGREKMMDDQNPSSSSFGKRKRLMELVFRFDIAGTVDPTVKLRDYIQSRHSGGLSAIGSGVKPARALTRDEISSLGLTRGKSGSRKLEGWEKIGPMPSGTSLHRVSRGLYSPRAPEVYGKALESARLPIYVLLADLPQPKIEMSVGFPYNYGDAQPIKDELDRRANELAAQGYTVLVMTRPIEKELGEILHRERGDRLRVNSMTPFVILHRMFDRMKRMSWSRPRIEGCLRNFKDWKDGYYFFRDVPLTGPKSEAEMMAMGSTGVNTWAGRNGLLVPNEAVSDLWAKYVLTGRIDYDKDATKDGVPWGPVEQSLRDDFSQCLHKIFPEFLEESKGKIYELGV